MNTTPLASVALLFAAASILLPALTLAAMRLLGKRLRHTACYLILLLCVIRILIPTGWTGPALLEFSAVTGSTEEATDSMPPISNLDSATEENSPDISDPSNGSQQSPVPDNQQSPSPDPNPITSASDFFVHHVDVVLLIIWAIGALATACTLIIPQMRLLRRERCFEIPVPEETATAYAEACARYRIKNPPALACLDLAVSPHICGILRPSIRLGNTPLTERELSFVLRHELCHHRRRDLLAKLVLTTALSVFWWNPLVPLLVKRTQEELELACDETVLTDASEEERCEYGGAILKILRGSQRARAPLSSVLSASGSATVTRFREITSLTRRHKGKLVILLFCLIFIGSGMILGCNASKNPPENSPPADVTDVFFIQGDCDLTEQQLKNISKSLVIPPHEGMHMIGWNVYTDSTENGGYSFRFEAAFEPNRYQIRLVGNGGTVKNADSERAVGAMLPSPQRAGYTFGGWYADVSLTQPIGRVPAENATLYAAWMEETPTNDFLYTERNGAVVILSYRGQDRQLTVPSHIGGKPVRAVAVNAFAFETELESVTLPETVTQIGAGAFRYCYSLRTVTLCGNVSYLDQSVFEACYALQQIHCPASAVAAVSAQLPTSVAVKPLDTH